MFLKVDRSHLHGHGCFTPDAAAAGEVVERSRLLVFPPEQTALLLRTNARNYLFFVKDGPDEDGPFFSGLAMSPASFCNHSDDPNCDFAVDAEAEEVTLTARRPIAKNEEITIDYGDYAEKII